MPQCTVRVQTEPFDINAETQRLGVDQGEIGAVASFIGYVRHANDQRTVHCLTLEHYPGMTEKALQQIMANACRQWPLNAATIIHRVGRLQPGDSIVLVLAASAHRHAAFDACAYMMDYLKTEAPFWKKEAGDDGQAHWVDARESDDVAKARWR